jgi:tetratricopeptide (TPR) repeat protein
MAKSMVEKYEQILAQDPASTVFVELAKALIEQGEHGKAIDVCQVGLSHHGNSVVGRVLWGKALINLGRPAEAMEQFDAAVTIDKDNAHAYNLIGEVLLHKGLYRSALPLLKKAVTLQPNDGRVRQWLEQTQRALAGGPAPVLRDATEVDAAVHTDPGLPPHHQPERTPVDVDPPDPFEGVPRRTDSSDTIRGITQTFDALAEEPNPFAEIAPPAPPGSETVSGLTQTFDALAEPERPGHKSEPTIIPSAELMQEAGRERTDPGLAEDSGILGNLPPPPQTGEANVPESGPRAAAAPRRALLDDIPDAAEMVSAIDVPKVDFSRTATKQIAEEYERELRSKLAEQASHKTFLQRHGAKLAVLAVLGVAAGVGVLAWRYTLAKHHGLDLKDALARAKVGITQDTGPSYAAALEALQEGARMDDRVPELWALSGFAHSLLFAEHGSRAEDRAAAVDAFGRPGISDSFAGLKLVSDYYLADAKARPAAAKAVLETAIDLPEVHELAGRLLIHKDVKGALDRLDRATHEAPSDVRALVALGDYYREAADYGNAVDAYSRALRVSPQHPLAVIGNAEAQIELQLDPSDSLKAVGDLKVTEDWQPGLAERHDLVLGRLLSGTGRHDEAIQELTQGLKQHKSSPYAFEIGLGEANRAAGRMGEAQKAYEAALAISKKDEAKEGLGRVLIARDRERDLLTRIGPEPESRRVSLVRGIAYARLADWKHARAELAHTQTNGKYPPEAVIHLALADAADGQAERAQQVLEKTLAASKRARGEVRVALGKVYWDRGALDKARAQFEEAAKEPSDYEGGCSLGRLLLHLGLPDVAVKPLSTAVEHNSSHEEARHALGAAYIQLGKPEDALKVFQAGVDDSPSSPGAERDLAWGLWALGRAKDAEAPISKSLKLETGDFVAQRVHAQVLFALGDGKAGFKALERANKLNPKDADTFCEIGRAFLRQGSNEMADKAFQAAKRENAESACALVGIRLAALPSGGRQAEKELNELANNQSTAVPDKAYAEAGLARVLLALSRPKDARKAAEQAVSWGPHSGDAYLALGLVALRQKDDAKAREALQQAVALEPAHAAAQLALGDVLQRGGEADAPAAVAAYEAFLRIGGPASDEARVKRALSNLKKKVASR